MPEHSSKEHPQKENEKPESSSIHASPMGRSAMPPEDPMNPNGEENGQVRQLSSFQTSVNQNSGVTQLIQRQDGINQSLNGGNSMDGSRSFAPPQLNLQVSKDKVPIQRTSARKSGPVMQLMAVNVNVAKNEQNSTNNNLGIEGGIINGIQISGRPTLGLTGPGMGDHLSPFILREEIIKKKLIGKPIQEGLSNLAGVVSFVIQLGFNEQIAPQPKENKSSKHQKNNKKPNEKKSSYQTRKDRYIELQSRLNGPSNSLVQTNNNINSKSKMDIGQTISTIQSVVGDILSLWELSNFSGIKRDPKRQGFKVGGSRNEAGGMAYLRRVEDQLESNEKPDQKEVLNVVVDLFDHAALGNVLGNDEQEDHFKIKDEKMLVNKLAVNHYYAIKMAFPHIGKLITLKEVEKEFSEEANWAKGEVKKYLLSIQEKSSNLNNRNYDLPENRSNNLQTIKENKEVDRPEWEFNHETKKNKSPQKTSKKENTPNSGEQETNGMVQILLNDKSRVMGCVFGVRPKSPFGNKMGAHSTAWVVHQERLLKRIRGKDLSKAFETVEIMVGETDTLYQKRGKEVNGPGMEKTYFENRKFWMTQYSQECIRIINETRKESPKSLLPPLQLLIQSYFNYFNLIWGTTIDNTSGPNDEKSSMKVLREFEEGNESNNNRKNTKIDTLTLNRILIPRIWNLFDFEDHEDFHPGMKKVLLEQHFDFILEAFPRLGDYKNEICRGLSKRAGIDKKRKTKKNPKTKDNIRRSNRLKSSNNINNNFNSDESSSEDTMMKSSEHLNKNSIKITGNKRKLGDLEDIKSNTQFDSDTPETENGRSGMLESKSKRQKKNPDKNPKTSIKKN